MLRDGMWMMRWDGVLGTARRDGHRWAVEWEGEGTRFYEAHELLRCIERGSIELA